MRFVAQTIRPFIAAVACCGLLSAAGCCNGLICSQRIAEFGPPPEVNGVAENTSDCGCAGSLISKLHGHAHAAGTNHGIAAAQHTMRPPQPRFLPVPTRPVFAPRPEYEPPHPLGLAPAPNFGEPTPAFLDEHEPPPLVAPESALPLLLPTPAKEPRADAEAANRSAAKVRIPSATGSARSVSVRMIDGVTSSPLSAKSVQTVIIR